MSSHIQSCPAHSHTPQIHPRYSPVQPEKDIANKSHCYYPDSYQHTASCPAHSRTPQIQPRYSRVQPEKDIATQSDCYYPVSYLHTASCPPYTLPKYTLDTVLSSPKRSFDLGNKVHVHNPRLPVPRLLIPRYTHVQPPVQPTHTQRRYNPDTVLSSQRRTCTVGVCSPAHCVLASVLSSPRRTCATAAVCSLHPTTSNSTTYYCFSGRLRLHTDLAIWVR